MGVLKKSVIMRQPTFYNGHGVGYVSKQGAVIVACALDHYDDVCVRRDSYRVYVVYPGCFIIYQYLEAAFEEVLHWLKTECSLYRRRLGVYPALDQLKLMLHNRFYIEQIHDRMYLTGVALFGKDSDGNFGCYNLTPDGCWGKQEKGFAWGFNTRFMSPFFTALAAEEDLSEVTQKLVDSFKATDGAHVEFGNRLSVTKLGLNGDQQYEFIDLRQDG